VLLRDQPGEGEVEVADVVDGHDGAAGARHVLLAVQVEPQAQPAEDGVG
jgi:hypothetical protein